MIKAHTIPLNNTEDGPTEYETCYGPFVDKEPGVYPLQGMNDYQRLEAYKWQLVHKGAHWDYYRKFDKRGNKWDVAVPETTYTEMIFYRNDKRLSPRHNALHKTWLG